MNSVSPTATQYVTAGMQDELAENRRQQPPPPPELQGSCGPRRPQPAGAGREVTGEPDEVDKLKARLMSAWNNVKYGASLSPAGRCSSAEWDLLTCCPFIPAGWTVKSKTSFNKVSPVTILGDSYLLNSEGELQVRVRAAVSVKAALLILLALGSPSR